MLKIEISSEEVWDEVKECFVPPVKQTLQLEHSLISISKWESKFHKSYLDTKDKTFLEHLYYIECMVVNSKFDPNILYLLSDDNLEDIGNYINDPMTATVINRSTKKSIKKKIITSELIYYYMTVFNIPVEFEKWHINRLITLIQICEIEQGNDKPLSKEETIKKYSEINAERRARFNSSG